MQGDDMMIDDIKAIRDERRPQLDEVVRVFTRIFNRIGEPIRRVDTGPHTWSWLDTTMAHMGFEKWFVLSTSTMEDTRGYPLLTIRQSTAPRLDAWVTVSQLVLGPTEKEIESSLVIAINNLIGAFEGLRTTVSDTFEAITQAAAGPTGGEMN